MRRSHSDQPALITTARQSPDDEYDSRRKKYAILMATRAACVLAAALTYRVSIWLALGLVVGGAVLPWCAVLIANDRPAKKQVHLGHVMGGHERALPPGSGDERTIQE
jgi:hypothetical protein